MADVTGTFYPAEDAIDGYGGQIEVGNGASPELFEAIAGVKSIKPGAGKTKDKDRTHLRSPGAHMEHAPGMRDHDAIQFTGVYLKGAQSLTTAGGGTGAFAAGGLPALQAARTIHNFRIIANDGSPATALIIRGYVSEFSLDEIATEKDWGYNGAIQPTEDYDHP